MLLTIQHKHENARMHFTAEIMHRINAKEIQQMDDGAFCRAVRLISGFLGWFFCIVFFCVFKTLTMFMY